MLYVGMGHYQQLIKCISEHPNNDCVHQGTVSIDPGPYPCRHFFTCCRLYPYLLFVMPPMLGSPLLVISLVFSCLRTGAGWCPMLDAMYCYIYCYHLLSIVSVRLFVTIILAMCGLYPCSLIPFVGNISASMPTKKICQGYECNAVIILVVIKFLWTINSRHDNKQIVMNQPV